MLRPFLFCELELCREFSEGADLRGDLKKRAPEPSPGHVVSKTFLLAGDRIFREHPVDYAFHVLQEAASLRSGRLWGVRA